jgi:signal transduction histidine kinase
MSVRTWFRPPHRLLALFLVITLAPSALLMAFGWRLLAQERELQAQQVEERRHQAADLVVSVLEQTLVATEQALRDDRAIQTLASTADAVTVVFAPNRIDAFPPGRLLYYPQPKPGIEAPASVFETGEALELRDNDAVKAATWFRQLARSDNSAVRAGALIRLARNLRKANQSDLALAAYSEAGAVDGAVIDGLPADLLARWARCKLLAQLQRDEALRQEASALYHDLMAGRWQIDRATYELHVADASRWIGTRAPPISDNARALTISVERLWEKWQQTEMSRAELSGRERLTVGDVAVTLLWHIDSDRFAALAAGPDYVEHQWLAKLSSALERQRVRVSLRDPASRNGEAGETRRVAGETGLPWTVAVQTLDVENERLTAWQRLWLGGLTILIGSVAAATYFIGRAMSRELAVARLQNDFVGAVSHEFRTPLTSLRQLTEILLDRPDTSTERRRSYYEALARQTERLHRLVESLLDFGRMEAGTSPYRFQQLDAATLVQSVVEQFQSEIAGRGYHVALDADGSSATVAADAEALSTAIWNLLDNAVKYSPEARTVWVTVGREGALVMIRVRDAGLGIPHAEQHDIFKKFFRGATARAENISGTGIGLAMVEYIVTAHRGRVAVQSQPGAGSTFTIQLPIEELCPES